MKLFDSQVSLLQKGLDASWKRNQVIGNNIANADTPGFKASRVEFENILKDKLSGVGEVGMKKTNRKHFGSSNLADGLDARVVTNNSTSMRLDGNNVDIENEMTELAKNSTMYQFLTQKMSRELYKYKYVISEGKG